MRHRYSIALAAALLGSAALHGGPAEPLSPGAVEGLVAWYDVDTLHGNTQQGEGVPEWPDASGNGHTLTADHDHARGLFRTVEAGSKPAVFLRKSGSYSVTNPFVLQDHTIFVVFYSNYAAALLESDEDSKSGVLLREDGRAHRMIDGAGRGGGSYTIPTRLGTDFTLTVLGRDRGVLRAFLDGEDVSSGSRAEMPLRVGRLFHIKMTEFVDRDADGMRLAELVFFDRFLGDAERAAVTAHLAAKYDLEISAPTAANMRETIERLADSGNTHVARLETKQAVQVNNKAGVGIPWDVKARADAPFRHDGAEDPTHLHVTRDGTRIRIYVTLPLVAAKPGADLRLMLLQNDVDYHVDQAISGPFGGPGGAGRKTLELGTTLFLDAGDTLEVVVIGEGAEGEVKLDPTGALLLAEAP